MPVWRRLRVLGWQLEAAHQHRATIGKCFDPPAQLVVGVFTRFWTEIEQSADHLVHEIARLGMQVGPQLSLSGQRASSHWLDATWHWRPRRAADSWPGCRSGPATRSTS